MNVYIAYKFTNIEDKQKLRENIEKIALLLKTQSHNTFILGRDLQRWENYAYSMHHKMFTMLKKIRSSDIVVAYVSSSVKSRGLLFELFWARVFGKKIIFVKKEDIKKSLSEMFATRVLKYDNFETFLQGFCLQTKKGLNKFTENGYFLMMALDHRGSFKKILNSQDPNSVDERDIIDTKYNMLKAGSNFVSGFLVDSEYGLKSLKRLKGVVKPFLIPIEQGGYVEIDEEYTTELQFSVKDLVDMGASGVKLLLHFNPDMKYIDKQITVAKNVLEDAKRHDMPFFLEPRSFNKSPEDINVVKTVEILLEAGVRPDVFKLEYPGSKEKCLKVSKLLGNTPWILLTRGQGFLDFHDHLKTAKEAGCSGFLAGRSLWKEFGDIKKEDRVDFFSTTMVEKLKDIRNVMLT